MKAIDTNVMLRLIVGDDPAHEDAALALLDTGPIFVSPTVLIEAEWVLRSAYRWSRDRIADALTDFGVLEGVEYDEPAGIAWAIGRHRAGADFADMVHLVTASDADAFVTFDRGVARRAGDTTPIPIETIG